MSKVLIIEDDKNILELEKDYLEASGFDVSVAVSGDKGLEMALNEKFDIILLDIMLPNIDGFDICKRVRAEKNIPIILISAKKSELDKVDGLGFGADDYIVKPFSPKELVARVKAHLARYERLTKGAEQGNTLSFEKLRLSKASGEAFFDGINLNLTKKEFDVLWLMVSRPDAVFTKNELFERVWGYDSLGDTSTLTVHINRLRDKIKEISPDADYIKTIWGRGYRLK